MLQLTEISKAYQAGDRRIPVLKGISLRFRSHEFVSILGPSGCGKTTLLNIMGGLDRCTGGQMLVGGRPTGHFTDRDWDAYRNHCVGFVFQGYQLIPHQTILQNVELTLTLSGVPRKQRRRRAVEALKQVGLGDQLKKRPSQLSGGQMQRAAIARALVNDPQILLADEPTGALDTESSKQVMELLKKISEQRLVIMVTHNPELAEQYSTRIIRMSDGRVLRDTNPPGPEEPVADPGRKGGKMPSMSFATAFGLSMKNLWTKKGRTALTAFAGSIGIIGIALIFAISQGTGRYIRDMQEETLTAYPLTLEASSVNLQTLMETFMDTGPEGESHDREAVYTRSRLYDLVEAVSHMEDSENDLESFYGYLRQRLQQEPEGDLRKALNGVACAYDLNLSVYTQAVDGKIICCDPEELLTEAMTENLDMDISAMLHLRETVADSVGPILPGATGCFWGQLLPGMDRETVSPVLQHQYQVLAGRWPERYNEIVLVVSREKELDDLTLYALGLKSRQEVDSIFDAAAKNQGRPQEKQAWDYEKLLGMEFRAVLSGDCYGADGGAYGDLRRTEAGLRYLYDNGIPLKVTGILRPRTGAAMLQGTIGYTQALTDYVIGRAGESEAVQAQLEAPDRDIFTGLPFRLEGDEAEQAAAFRSHVAAMEADEKSACLLKIRSIPEPETLAMETDSVLEKVSREQMRQELVAAMGQQITVSPEALTDYVQKMQDQELLELYRQLIQQQLCTAQARQAAAGLAGTAPDAMAELLDREVSTCSDACCARYYQQVLSFSDSTLEENLKKLGCVRRDNPSELCLYASSFQNKQVLEQLIRDYNNSVGELQKIHYTDYVGLIMDSVTTMLRAITYVLTAFVSVALVVSSLMIGVITLISVQERTREIGILRSIGASRRNVSGMFNAETVMIGLASGILGVGATVLLCPLVNRMIRTVTGIQTLKASLPWQAALVLIAVSVGLTLLSGLIPSRSASGKDPAAALRTE